MDFLKQAQAAIDDANKLFTSQSVGTKESGLLKFSTAVVPFGNVALDLGITLFPHQEVIVETVAAGYRHLLIADQMGVGKTASAIACLESEEAFPALVVCPAALKRNWATEILRALPHRTVQVLSGMQPGSVDADIVICPDSILHAWTMDENGSPTGILGGISWEALVVDECHIFKNLEAQRTKAILGISRKLDEEALRLAMSGTPILNKPMELIPTLEIIGMLEPLFGGARKFKSRYMNWEQTAYGAKPYGARNMGELHDRLRDYCMIRRLRSEVLTLPNKGRLMEYVELPDTHKRKYNQAIFDLQEFFRQKTGDKDYKINRSAKAMTLLSALRHVVGMGKVNAVVEKAEELLEDGEPVFICCTHTDVVDELRKRLFPHGVVSIVGGMSADQKQKAVDDFQAGKAQVCIGNIKAAGVGFTLTRAANIIVAELPWTPGELQQVEDRLHRIGQKRPVTSTVLMAEWESGSVDERLWKIMDGKAQIINAILDGEYTGLEIHDEESYMNQLLNQYEEEATSE